jgi:hypothetical protein
MPPRPTKPFFNPAKRFGNEHRLIIIGSDRQPAIVDLSSLFSPPSGIVISWVIFP